MSKISSEDKLDLEEARAALKESKGKGTVPWDKVKTLAESGENMNPYDMRSDAEKWNDELRDDHIDNHRRGLDELWGGKGAKGCTYCDEENEKAKES